MIKNGIFLILSFCTFMVYGQSPVSIKLAQLPPKELKIYKEGIQFSKQGKSKEALKNFDKVLKKQPLFLEAKLRKAGLFYDVKDFANAQKLIEEVVRQDSNYDGEMYYAAALCAIMQKDYVHASQHYTQYLKRAVGLQEDKIKKIKHEIAVCDFRIDAYLHPKPFGPKPIEGFINTDDLEYLPSLSIDGTQMVFTRRIDGQEDLFVSIRNKDTWGIPTPLESINTLDNEAAHTMSEDGNTIIFTACNNKVTGYGSCDLYKSIKENNVWSKPANMGNKVNSSAWDSQPTMAKNGALIIFSSDRMGSIGGHDLWMIKKGRNGKWEEAVNLGDKINTTGHEESPFIHPDGKTLFFRSNGHIGMGASDIFYSKYDSKTATWSHAVNMGYPINTEGDEGSLFVDAKGENAYYATDKDTRNTGKANLDIYTFPLPMEVRPDPVSYIKVSITDAVNGNQLNANFSIIDLDNMDTVIAGIASNGIVLSAISKDKNYALLIDKENYFMHSENFNTQSFYDASKPYEVSVRLKPITEIPETPIVLNNLFFETGSAVLMDASQSEIDNLAKFLQINNLIKIKIVGHTDNVGSDSGNQLLSEQRAKAVQDALIKKGIIPDRLSYAGKGESMPIADNTIPEGRKANRRTEFMVIK
jgi:outer membrane protein OmpA-like peptidoglycan-associated protein/tetratricopeptide (TPR) repeat protein